VIHWKSNFPYSLEDLFDKTGRILQSKWTTVQKKHVGWQIPFDGDFHIDVIPGKFSSTNGDYAYIFYSETNGRFKTSIEIHTDYVLNSHRQNIIKLLKLWKIRKQVPIKTFILEGLIIEGCKGMARINLEPQLISALNFIETNILSIKLIDPANTNNVITDDLNYNQKYQIKQMANWALNTQSWGEVFRGI
jgi:hypothetical protein